jgi:uncharacterized membrane protein YjjP (DUF1212 family)
MTGTRPPRPGAAPAAEDEVLGFLGLLVETLLTWSAEGTMRSESTVRDVAARYGHTVEVAFFADAAVLTVGERTLSFAREPTVPPLHQVSEAKRLLGEIDRGGLDPAAAAERLAAIRAMPVRWSKPWQVLGLTLFSVGFGISVQATWQEVGVSALAGLLVGLLVVAGQRHRRLALVAPFLASLIVSVVVLEIFNRGWLDGGPIQLIVPALFYFIPGDAITLAAVVLAQVPQRLLFDVTVPGNLGTLGVWAGWVLFALGVMLTFSMAPSTSSPPGRTVCGAWRAGSAATRSRVSPAWPR